MSVQPEWVDVDSSNVSRIIHNPDTETLGVKFYGGGFYSYTGVDEDVYASLVGASSVGEYLSRAIKGVYPYTKHYSEEELLNAIAV